MATKSNNNARSAKVVETIKQRIYNWEYPPGHRLLEERLCEEFGVSRSPVREALRLLAAQGLVQLVPHAGYHVQALSVEEIHNLYEVRLALELYVVEQLAKHEAKGDQLTKLRETWSTVPRPLEENPEKWATLDRDFHEALANMLGNGALLNSLVTIDDRLQLLRVIDFAVPGRATTTIAEHLEVLDAIAKGDVSRARNAVTQNVSASRGSVESAVQQALFKSYMQ